MTKECCGPGAPVRVRGRCSPLGETPLSLAPATDYDQFTVITRTEGGRAWLVAGGSLLSCFPRSCWPAAVATRCPLPNAQPRRPRRHIARLPLRHFSPQAPSPRTGRRPSLPTSIARPTPPSWPAPTLALHGSATSSGPVSATPAPARFQLQRQRRGPSTRCAQPRPRPAGELLTRRACYRTVG